jgi:lantibiotic biosynthesis protein
MAPRLFSKPRVLDLHRTRSRSSYLANMIMRLNWQPILVGQEAARATAAIQAIAESLAEWPPFPEHDPSGSSLASGEAGIALLFAYLAKALPHSEYADRASDRLERAIERLATSFYKPGLFEGFLSIAWTVEHLHHDQGGDDDPNEEIDRALYELLAKTPWRGEYDLTSGLAGFGAYALERWPGSMASACLSRVCERLEELAMPQDVGIAWPTAEWNLRPEEQQSFPHGMVNLGVAHGLPGVLPVLARAAAVGVTAEPARALLRGAVAWLLSRKLSAHQESVFPYAWGPGAELRPARAGWCYGDPGIAVTLLITARAAGVPSWEAEALGLARTAARRTSESSGVRDAGLCHGAAGLGHLFNRLYHFTGDPELLIAARTWMARALDMRQTSGGVGGYVAWKPTDTGEMGWCDDPCLLTGAAGVALALLAATTPVEPAWDRFLVPSPTRREEKGATHR